MDEVKSTNTDKYERHDSGAKHNPRQGAEDGLWSACCLQVHLVPPRKSQVVVTHPPHWALYLVPICTGYLGPTGSGTWDQLALVPVTHWLWYLGPTVWGPWYLLDMGPGLQLVLVVTPSCTVLWLIFINLYFKGLCNRLQIGIAQERCDQVDLKFNVVEQDKPWLPRKILVDWNTRHFYDASQNIASPVFYPLSRSRKKIKYFQPPNRTSGKRDIILKMYFFDCHRVASLLSYVKRLILPEENIFPNEICIILKSWCKCCDDDSVMRMASLILVMISHNILYCWPWTSVVRNVL